MGTTPDQVRRVSIGDAEVWASQVQAEQRDARMKRTARAAGLEG